MEKIAEVNHKSRMTVSTVVKQRQNVKPVNKCADSSSKCNICRQGTVKNMLNLLGSVFFVRFTR